MMSISSIRFPWGRKFLVPWVAILAAMVTYSGGVFAQLEEVIVTATKRTSDLQDVGVAVSAFNGDTLERLNIKDSEELLARVPNLDIRSTAGSTNANIFLRGIGTTGIGFNVQSGVGIYADEVALNSPVVNILQTYDLERVEVLAGPQNTLYGRNTTGGAVNFISRKPEIGGEANGKVSLSYGRFNQFDIDAAFGAPIGDNAAIRFAALANYRDGIRDNTVTGFDDVDVDKVAARVQLAIAPSDRVDINFKAHMERVRSGNVRWKVGGDFDPDDITQPCPDQGVGGGQIGCQNGLGFTDSNDMESITADMLDAGNDVDAGGASMHMDVEFEDFILTSITAYEENEQFLSEDTDAFDAHVFHFFLESEQDQVSQEFRLASTGEGPLKWIVGAYGFWESKQGTTGPTFAAMMTTMVTRAYAELDNTTYSGYVDFEYELSEKVSLKGGYRASTDKIEGSAVMLMAFETSMAGIDVTSPSFSGGPLPDFFDMLDAAIEGGITEFSNGTDGPGAGPQRIVYVGGPNDPGANIEDTTFDEWGGKFGIDFRPADGVLAYAQWSRGFKAGQFTTAPMAIMLGQGDTPLQPEIVDTYELGLKTEFADGRARLNVAAFFNDYTDQQLGQFVGGEFQVVSADSEIYGVDVNFNWVPVDGTFVDVGFGYLESEITKAPDGSPEQKGNRTVGTPEFSGIVAFRKEWEQANGAIVSLGFDGRYSDEKFFDLSNERPVEDYFLVGSQLMYEFGEDNQHRISLWGKNIFDEEYFVNRADDADPLERGSGDTWLPGTPRTYGVSFSTSF